MLSIMLETGEDSGQYEMTTSSTWPTSGYVFNSELSKCENGSTLSWDDTNKQVVFSGNITDKCYVYFDVNSPKILSDVCSGGENLSSGIIDLSNKSTSAATNIYYHDSSLENSAGDNSYRYAGASEDVKNYICLGSSETTCPDDNLYRIIGVFGEENHGVAGEQLVKVIKNTSIGNIEWNDEKYGDWETSSLNTTLNSTFKTEKLAEIEDEITEVTWKVSGYSNAFIEVAAKAIYTEEITNATKTYTSKIGLMYISDYGFATTLDYWTTNLGSYNSAAKDKNWLYLGSTEWTLSANLTNKSACRVGNVGYVDCLETQYDPNAVRPVFFLTSSVQYSSGSGTSTDPIRIK